jgi:hypothetical protein
MTSVELRLVLKNGSCISATNAMKRFGDEGDLAQVCRA